MQIDTERMGTKRLAGPQEAHRSSPDLSTRSISPHCYASLAGRDGDFHHHRNTKETYRRQADPHDRIWLNTRRKFTRSVQSIMGATLIR